MDEEGEHRRLARAVERIEEELLRIGTSETEAVECSLLLAQAEECNIQFIGAVFVAISNQIIRWAGGLRLKF